MALTLDEVGGGPLLYLKLALIFFDVASAIIDILSSSLVPVPIPQIC